MIFKAKAYPFDIEIKKKGGKDFLAQYYSSRFAFTYHELSSTKSEKKRQVNQNIMIIKDNPMLS